MAFRQIVHNLRPQVAVSVIAIMCAVFCLSFLFSENTSAFTMSQPDYGISASNLNLSVKDNSGYVHSSNYLVTINIPVGSWMCIHALAMQAYGRPVVVPPKKFARLIMSVTSNDLTTSRIILFYSGNANIVLSTKVDIANFKCSWENTSYVTIDVYNPLDRDEDFYLGGQDAMFCGRVPSSYALAESLSITVNSFVVYSSASSNIQN